MKTLPAIVENPETRIWWSSESVIWSTKGLVEVAIQVGRSATAGIACDHTCTEHSLHQDRILALSDERGGGSNDGLSTADAKTLVEDPCELFDDPLHHTHVEQGLGKGDEENTARMEKHS